MANDFLRCTTANQGHISLLPSGLNRAFSMATPTPPLKRIDLRTTPEIKKLTVRAASAESVSLSAFLIACAQDRTQQMLVKRETLTFSPRNWPAFFTAMDNVDQTHP
jgi:uncharacterized protein (DUF1778 family)